MFRRFADKLSNAVAQATMTTEQQHIATLCSMGYSEQDARAAYQACNGNVDAAAERLLTSAPNTNHTNNAAMTSTMQQQEDDDLQRALQASMIQDDDKPKPATTTSNIRSAASRKAGQAALGRFEKSQQQPSKKKKAGSTTAGKSTNSASNNNTANQKRSKSPIASHPNVKVPQKLSDKTKEEQIMRTADRLKAHPQAVDTLYKALKGLQSNPSDPKFSSIDQSTIGYQKSLANAPGAEDLLLAMNYQKSGVQKKLNLILYDPATIYLGISALEQIKNTSKEYQNNKAILQMEREIQSIQTLANSSTEEAIQRAEFMSKCPSEPSGGSGSWMYIQLTKDQTIQRRFDGDDTLQDVLHWLGGHGTGIYQHLMETKDWYLVDMHRNPPLPYKDLSTLQTKTLQYIGCWPSGKLAIQPTSIYNSTAAGDGSTAGTSNNEVVGPGSSRGLGAAPSDVL